MQTGTILADCTCGSLLGQTHLGGDVHILLRLYSSSYMEPTYSNGVDLSCGLFNQLLGAQDSAQHPGLQCILGICRWCSRQSTLEDFTRIPCRRHASSNLGSCAQRAGSQWRVEARVEFCDADNQRIEHRLEWRIVECCVRHDPIVNRDHCGTLPKRACSIPILQAAEVPVQFLIVK